MHNHDSFFRIFRVAVKALLRARNPSLSAAAVIAEVLRESKRLSGAEREAASLLAHTVMRFRLTGETILTDSLRVGGEATLSRNKKNAGFDNEARTALIVALSYGAALHAHNTRSSTDDTNAPPSSLPPTQEELFALAVEYAAQRHGIPEANTREILANAAERFRQAWETAESIVAVPENSDDQAWQALETRFSLPAWILRLFAVHCDGIHGTTGLYALCEALLVPAQPVLRVNTLRMSRAKAYDALETEGIQTAPARFSPVGLTLVKRQHIAESDVWRSGFAEIQDEASQLAAYAVGPEPGWNILDACAGAGGKTLHLAALLGNTGTLTASDTQPLRLKQIRERARRAGAENIRVASPAMFDRLPEHERLFDAVLVDAPCSGLGTLRRNPLLKYHVREKTVERLATKQLAVLTQYAAFVKPGGVLVYSTCSLLRRENQTVAERFLESNPDFLPDPLAPVFAQYGIDVPALESGASHITLLPSMHGTDGFFIARMRKTL